MPCAFCLASLGTLRGIDTTLLHPALIRTSIDLLGADNVVVGSDWPIGSEAPTSGPLATVMDEAGFSENEQHAVASSNVARLMGFQ